MQTTRLLYQDVGGRHMLTFFVRGVAATQFVIAGMASYDLEAKNLFVDKFAFVHMI